MWLPPNSLWFFDILMYKPRYSYKAKKFNSSICNIHKSSMYCSLSVYILCLVATWLLIQVSYWIHKRNWANLQLAIITCTTPHQNKVLGKFICVYISVDTGGYTCIINRGCRCFLVLSSFSHNSLINVLFRLIHKIYPKVQNYK